MNILFFYRIYPEYGGVEVVTTILANRMVSDGHRVSIASIEQPHMELKSQLNKSVNLIKLSYPVLCKDNVDILHQYIVEKRVDVVINQWGLPFKTTMLCNRAIKGTRCKLISVLHGSPYTSKTLLLSEKKYHNANILLKPFYYGVYKLKDWCIRKSIQHAVAHNEKYILLSKSFISPLINYAHLKNANNILAIGNPITIDVKKELIDIPNKKKQLLYVGRMDLANKNVDRIVETWRIIWEKYPEWQLVLVGDGPDKFKLIDYVNNNNIGNVEFKGFQKEPPIKYYADASIFLLMSNLEGFGLVVVESMSYGIVPVVYGSYEAIYDIIEENKSGFILPKPFKHSDLASKIEYLIQNEEERRTMAIEAIERSKLFNLDSIINKWYEVLAEITDNS